MSDSTARITYYPMYETTDNIVIKVTGIYLYKWKYLYPEAQEIMPRHIPEALEKYVVIKSYLGSNQEGNMKNRR